MARSVKIEKRGFRTPKKGAGIDRIVVRAKPGDQRKGLLQVGATVFPCALGRGGISSNKREGAQARSTLNTESERD